MKARLKQKFVAYDEPDELSTRKIVGVIESGTEVWITFYDESEIYFDVEGEDTGFTLDQDYFDEYFQVLQPWSSGVRQQIRELFMAFGGEYSRVLEDETEETAVFPVDEYAAAVEAITTGGEE